jgi:hypothetical protein
MPTVRIARNALLAALTLLPSAIPAGPSADLSPAARPGVSAAGTWHFDALQPAVVANVTTDAALAVPASRPVLALVDGSIAVDGDVAACRGVGQSCSFSEPAGAATPWRIHLDGHVTAETHPSQRFLVLHEIGHAVWGLVLGASDRRAFVAAVDRSLAGAPCRRADGTGPCASIGEIFADEFARWAGGFRVSMSWYDTPALLDGATFGQLMSGAVRAAGLRAPGEAR